MKQTKLWQTADTRQKSIARVSVVRCEGRSWKRERRVELDHDVGPEGPCCEGRRVGGFLDSAWLESKNVRHQDSGYRQEAKPD